MRKLILSFALCLVMILSIGACTPKVNADDDNYKKQIQQSIKLRELKAIPRIYKGRVIH